MRAWLKLTDAMPQATGQSHAWYTTKQGFKMFRHGSLLCPVGFLRCSRDEASKRRHLDRSDEIPFWLRAVDRRCRFREYHVWPKCRVALAGNGTQRQSASA